MQCAPYAAIPLYDRWNDIVGWAVVDQDDYEWLNGYRWRQTVHGYVERSMDGGETISMHRQILGLASGNPLEGDHLNCVTYDNRRANLKATTRALNRTRRPRHRAMKSGHRGIYWVSDRKRWRVQIRFCGHKYNVGYFDDLADAVTACGEFRQLRFAFVA